jgi:hypothetical protein
MTSGSCRDMVVSVSMTWQKVQASALSRAAT